jgi:NADP-dependent 3-hydroxy acid dehydrogenase YdfG
LDVFFNNAGIMHIGTVEEVDVDAVCRMIRLNVEALVRASYTVLKVFKKQGNGFLINTSSFAGLKTFKTIAAYNGTKFAVEAFTDSLRMELAGTGIRVSCVQPGRTQTHLFDHWKPEQLFSPDEGMIPADAVARCIQFVLEQPEDVVIPRILVMPSRQPT